MVILAHVIVLRMCSKLTWANPDDYTQGILIKYIYPGNHQAYPCLLHRTICVCLSRMEEVWATLIK